MDSDVQSLQAAMEHVVGGKRVGGSVYLHVSAVIPPLREWVDLAIAVAGVDPGEFSVVRVDTGRGRIALLDYPEFFERAFPRLERSWLVDVAGRNAKHRKFSRDSNQPVLHRKELLLDDEDPRRAEYAEITATLVRLGLLSSGTHIGHAWQWAELLERHGLREDGERLVARVEHQQPGVQVARHRTAMHRNRLSSPMHALWRHGFFEDPDVTVFDYGCGRGDDVAALEAAGLDVVGWDPYYHPDAELRESTVVNLGFVINVIEKPAERKQALLAAWRCTTGVLAVSAMVAGRATYEKYDELGDGVVTQRNTFQKYYTHKELGAYILKTLGREPVSAAPGVYFVFRTDEAEQVYLEQKQRSGRTLGPAPVVPDRPRGVASGRKRNPDRWVVHADLLNAFWHSCLTLGRLPRVDEFEHSEDLRTHLGTPKRVLAHLIEQRGSADFDQARKRRRRDLLVFLALNLFQPRNSFGSLPAPVQNDIKEHCGSFRGAMDEAKELLFAIADTDLIELACVNAVRRQFGYFDEDEVTLTLESRLVVELPAILRAYIGAAEQLFGEVEASDLVCIRIESSQLLVLTYDDFYGKRLPVLVESIEVDLARQRVEHQSVRRNSRPLYLKSRYLHPTTDGYDQQKAFDHALEGLGVLDLSGQGPTLSELAMSLKEAGVALPTSQNIET